MEKTKRFKRRRWEREREQRMTPVWDYTLLYTCARLRAVWRERQKSEANSCARCGIKGRTIKNQRDNWLCGWSASKPSRTRRRRRVKWAERNRSRRLSLNNIIKLKTSDSRWLEKLFLVVVRMRWEGTYRVSHCEIPKKKLQHKRKS